MKVGIVGAGNAGIALYALMLEDQSSRYDPLIYSSAAHMQTLHGVYSAPNPLKLVDEGEDTGFRLSRDNLNITHSVADVVNHSDILINTLPIYGHIPFFDEAYAVAKRTGKLIPMVNLSGGFAIFDHILKQRQAGENLIPIASSHTLPYAARVTQEGGVGILNRRNETLISVDQNTDLPKIVDDLADFMGTPLTQSSNHLYCAIDRSSYVMHPIITALNFNKIERKEPFFFYKDGLTDTTYRFLVEAGRERRDVCLSLGFNDFILPEERMKNFLENYMKDFATVRPPSSANHRFFTEDIPYGLVFLRTLGEIQVVDMPLCDSVITLSSVICETDFWDTTFNLRDNPALADLVLEYHGNDAKADIEPPSEPH